MRQPSRRDVEALAHPFKMKLPNKTTKLLLNCFCGALSPGEAFLGPDRPPQLWDTPFPASCQLVPLPPDASGFVGFEEREVGDENVSVRAHALRSQVEANAPTKVGMGFKIGEWLWEF